MQHFYYTCGSFIGDETLHTVDFRNFIVFFWAETLAH